MSAALKRLLVCCLLPLLTACGGSAAVTAVASGTSTSATTSSASAAIPSSAATTPTTSTTAASNSAAAASAVAVDSGAMSSSATGTTAATSPSASTSAAATSTPATAASAPATAGSTAASAPGTVASTTGASITGIALPPAKTTYPLTVKDDQGTSVSFPARPRHVVSLAPSTTEIAYADGGGDVFVAGTEYDNYPPEAKSKATIKGLKPSLEAITADQPDLVLATTTTASDLVQQLRATHVPVLYLDAKDFPGVYRDLLLVGQVLDGVPAAERVVAGMQAEVAAVTAKVATAPSRPRVFVELDASDPAKLYTVGPGSFIDTLVTMSGGTNVAHDAASPYPQLSLEALVADDPQVIILSDAAYGTTPAAVAQRAGWSGISAVKEHHVYPIDADLVSRPGPRLADGLAAMARLVHPEHFP